MLKYNLREQGCSVTEHYQKHGKVTLIWAILMAGMIAAAFVSTALINGLAFGDFAYNTFLERVFDFFNGVAKSINTPFGYNGVTSIIYLLIWVGIFAAACYTAKNISLGIETGRIKKGAVRVILAILILAALFIFMAEIAYCYDEIEYEVHSDSTGYYHRACPPAFDFLYLFVSIFYSFGFGFGFLFYIIFVISLYMMLKLITTIPICSKKYGSIQFKILKNNAMPVCHCKEGVKFRQAFFIYFLPAIFMYSMIYILFIRNAEYILLIFLSFFIAFDLTAALYILYFKIRYKADYIALDSHIYDVTLFKESYVKFSGKKAAVSKSYVNVHAAIKQKEREKLFTEMTTCTNPSCENYALEFEPDERGEKRCPSCGKRKHIAKVFTGMMTCTNRDCEQFGQELKQDIEECEVCGSVIGQIAIKFNPGLVISSIIAAVASCIAYALIALVMYEQGIDMDGESVLLAVVNFAMFAVYVTGVVMAWVSKSKKVLVFAAVSLPVIALFLRTVVF